MKAVALVIALAAVFILWQWSRNGRYAMTGCGSVLDTRTGDVWALQANGSWTVTRLR